MILTTSKRSRFGKSSASSEVADDPRGRYLMDRALQGWGCDQLVAWNVAFKAALSNGSLCEDARRAADDHAARLS